MPKHSFHILLIDDDPAFNHRLHQIVADHGTSFGDLLPRITHKQNEDTALLFLNQQNESIDLILLGHPSEQKYLQTIQQFKNKRQHIPIAVLYDNESEKLVNALVKKEVLYQAHKDEFNFHMLAKIMALAISINELDFQPEHTPSTPPSENTQSLQKIFFEEVVQNSKEALFVLSKDARIQFANNAAAQIFGTSPSTLIGKMLSIPIRRLESKYFDENPRFVSGAFIKTIHQIGQIMEITVPLNTGVNHDFELRTTAIHDNPDEGFVINLRDITNSKRITQLTSEIKEKARINKLKDEFISIVSHEMRTPLTIIKGAVSNLKDGIVGHLTPPQQKIVDTTVRNIDRLARIINDLLDLSRLESGKARIEKRRLFLKPLITEIINNFKQATHEKHIKLHIEFGDSIPPIFADPDLITQVLTNLIQNATRYAKSNITVQVIHENLTPSTEPDKSNMVRIGVIDDGEGIPKNKIESLFNKFEQFDRPQGGSGYKGTGLGLAICKQITELHDGRIWAVSDINKGAQFYALFPAYRENDIFTITLDQLIHEAEKHDQQLSLLVLKLIHANPSSEQFKDQEFAHSINRFLDNIRSKALRKTDTIHYKREAREFIVFLHNTARENGTLVAKRIQSIAEETFCTDTKSVLSLHLSIGLAVYPDDSRYSSELFKLAQTPLDPGFQKENT